MKRKVRDFSLDIKAVSEKGEFSGYGSVYGVIDTYREMVAPGAFTASLDRWKEKGRLPPILWQHNSREPIGPFTVMKEDDKGLYVEGQLLIDDVEKAREARALMKAKAVTGMSIGFNVVVDEFNKNTEILTLKEIDLWEVSVVTFPANEAAQIEAVKSMISEGELPSLKTFEEILRDVGFSRAQAKTIVGHGYAGLLRDAESRTTVDAKSIIDEVFNKPIITLEDIFS
jgi:HK97 family phage prohead protease